MPELETEQPGFPFWSYEDLCLLLAAVLPSWLIAVLAVRLSGVAGKGAQTLILQTAVIALLLLVLYLLVAARYGKPFWRSLGWQRPVRGVWWCAASGPVLAVVAGALGVVLRAPELPDPVKGLVTGPIALAIVMLFVVALGPIYEELFFRGFLYPLLAKSFGAAAGIVLTALPFALLHGSQYQWAWQQVALVGLAGAAFGFVRYRTGSTAASTILHGCFNLTQFLGFLVTLRHL